jgi:hypothetical protein
VALVGALLFVIPLGFALLIGGFMVVRMQGMLMDRELTFPEFLVWLIAFLGLAATSLAWWGTAWGYFLVLITLGTALVVPLLSRHGERLGLQQMRVRDIETHLELARRRPDIPYSFRRLGEIFYQSGDWEPAIEYFERSLALHYDPEVAFHLQKAKERLALGPGQPQICCACGHLSPRRATECVHCSEELRPSGREVLAALGSGYAQVVLVVVAAGSLGGGLLLSLLKIGSRGGNAFLLAVGLLAAALYFVAAKAARADRGDRTGKD